MAVNPTSPRPLPRLIFENPHALTKSLDDLQVSSSDSSPRGETASTDEDDSPRGEVAPTETAPHLKRKITADDLRNGYEYARLVQAIMNNRVEVNKGFTPSGKNATFSHWAERIRTVFISTFEGIAASHLPKIKKEFLMSQLSGGFIHLNLVSLGTVGKQDEIALSYTKKCEDFVKKLTE